MVKSNKQKDIDVANEDFDKMIREFSITANRARPIMPLVALSLDLTVELLKQYKEAYNHAIGRNYK